jgi:ATP phosphoribosyltransferase
MKKNYYKKRRFVPITRKINSNKLLVLPKNSGLEEYRKLFEKLDNEKIIVRAEDVPYFVELLSEKNVSCIGLTGEDLFQEYKQKNVESNVKQTNKIKWFDEKALYKKPALCLLGKKQNSLENSVIAINKKYSSIAKAVLPKNTKKIYFNGSTETAFSKGLADFVFDIVYTGKSLKKAGLEIITKYSCSDIVLLEVKK